MYTGQIMIKFFMIRIKGRTSQLTPTTTTETASPCKITKGNGISMKDIEINELLSLVYHYYPKRCAFESREYQTSSEYSRYLSTVMDLTKRTEIDKMIFPHIAECATGYNVLLREHSNYENYPCIEYSVLLHKNHLILDDDVDLILSLGGKRLDLELSFSLLGNYFYYILNETVGGKDTLAWSFSVLTDEQLPHEEKMLIKVLCSKAVSLGFKLLSSNLAHTVVPEVATECINSGEATIYNCLFTDMKTHY